ncbi:MAG: ATP-binding cassette domain-containing protein [Evtepia gabavorous]
MLLSAEHISLNFGLKPLLDDVTLYLSQGDKVGLIGINGTGKSSFLRVLAGQQPPDQGSVTRDPNVQVCFLPQNPPMEAGATVLEQVFAGFSPDTRALLDYEAKAMLTRLGLTDFAQPVGTLSGGQRKRVALAAVLLHPADVLILDEPTNHLDSDMVLWLEDRLRKFTGGLVMVTHDRYFLERVCNRLELSPATPQRCSCLAISQQESEQAALASAVHPGGVPRSCGGQGPTEMNKTHSPVWASRPGPAQRPRGG